MSTGGTDWHPRCLLAPGTKNVAMEATIENFTKLFEVVHVQVVESAAKQLAAVQTPTRTPRRRASDPKAPTGSPDSRRYFIAKKGWVKRVKPDMPTPGSGSGSSQVRNKNRRFLKDTGLDRRGSISPTGPRLSRRVSAASNKRRKSTQVLSHDELTPPDTKDESSSEHNPYGSD